MTGVVPVPSIATALLLAAALLGAALAGFLFYIWVRYGPVVGRIFEEAPVFRPLSVPPEPGGEEVRFPAEDGLELAGTYFRARAPERAGVVVFCPEFLGDRWSAGAYGDGLRDLGFDLFTFDFRNHGDSASDPAYKPLQWVSDLETRDLRAALAYLRSRPDRDPAGVALFGVSRGGGAALCVAADDPGVWAVVTDGAFPTRGTMLAYIYRWAEIYVTRLSFWLKLPRWIFAFAGWTGRIRSEWKSGRRYPDMERAVGRLAPRPWLMVHGACDNYISQEIARGLFAHGGDPKDLWIVPKAKHNRCRDINPAAYRDRLAGFFRKHAPRRLEAAPAEPAPAPAARPAVAPAPVPG